MFYIYYVQLALNLMADVVIVLQRDNFWLFSIFFIVIQFDVQTFVIL